MIRYLITLCSSSFFLFSNAQVRLGLQAGLAFPVLQSNVSLMEAPPEDLSGHYLKARVNPGYYFGLLGERSWKDGQYSIQGNLRFHSFRYDFLHDIPQHVNARSHHFVTSFKQKYLGLNALINRNWLNQRLSTGIGLEASYLSTPRWSSDETDKINVFVNTQLSPSLILHLSWNPQFLDDRWSLRYYNTRMIILHQFDLIEIYRRSLDDYDYHITFVPRFSFHQISLSYAFLKK